jgi:hypothetical protein
MLGSYYSQYFPTPGQPRVAPGVGAYYSPENPQSPSLGAYYSPDNPQSPSLGAFESVSTGAIALNMAINAGAGYLVGKQIGVPAEAAIATGLFGILGMAASVFYASTKGAK